MSKVVSWQDSLEKALEMAKKEGKFVLLDFFNPG